MAVAQTKQTSQNTPGLLPAADLAEDVAVGPIDPALDAFLVQDRRALAHRLLGVETRRQHLVIHLDTTTVGHVPRGSHAARRRVIPL